MDSPNTRRHLRYQMHTPVHIPVPGEKTFVPGMVSKLSRAGMEIYAGVNLDPGDLMEVEFRTKGRTICICGIIRNRSGFCFGLEFCALKLEVG
jgi:hypothetical protein